MRGMHVELAAAVPDPALRRLVEATERAYRGHDAGVSVDVNGARTVLAVEVASGSPARPGEIGACIANAMNQALERAQEAIVALVRSDPRLSPQLRGLLDGDPLPGQAVAQGETLAGDFEGDAAAGMVVVHVSGRTRRVSSVYLHSLAPELVAAVPEAANRALAAAELGREGAEPLDERIDAVLERLETRLTAIQETMAGVDARLDAIEAGLG